MSNAAIPNTASIYVRLSREADASNRTLEGMVADCRALTARESLTVVDVHIDNGISGAVRNRPAFLAWLADGREGHADNAYGPDRPDMSSAEVAAL